MGTSCCLTAFVEFTFGASARHQKSARCPLFFRWLQNKILSCDWLNHISVGVVSVTIVFMLVLLGIVCGLSGTLFENIILCQDLVTKGYLWSQTDRCDSDRHLIISNGQLTFLLVYILIFLTAYISAINVRYHDTCRNCPESRDVTCPLSYYFLRG